MMLSTFSAVYADPDVAVRCQAVQMLVEQAKSCTSRKFEEIISLLQKVSNLASFSVAFYPCILGLVYRTGS